MGGNIPVGKFLGVNFAGRFFQRGGEGGEGVDGWEFFRRKFPRIMVSKVCLRLG